MQYRSTGREHFMTAPEDSVREPFPDVVADRRPPMQKREDACARQNQVDQLLHGPTSDDLVYRLQERREHADESVVRFEVAQSRSGYRVLVVPRQLLLPTARLTDEARRILARAGFEQQDLDQDGSGCEELQDRVALFRAPKGKGHGDWRQATDDLNRVGVTAAPTAV